METRGNALAAMPRTVSQVRKRVSQIRRTNAQTVYYAIGPDGLMTQFGDFFITIPFSWPGKIRLPGDQKTMGGLERVSLEEILLRNPEVIITPDTEFFASVGKEPDGRCPGGA